MVDEATRDRFALFWGAMAGLEVEAFPSKSETQKPLSLPVFHSGVRSLVPSSGNRWLLLRCTYPGTRWVFLVPR